MDLLDVADVETTAVHWPSGFTRGGRECGVLLELADACDPTTIAIRGTTASVPDQYKVFPFALRGILRRGVTCVEADDDTWWSAAFKASIEFAVTRALVIQPVAGTESWVGDASVQTVALGGSPTDAALATAVMAGRAQWMNTVTSVKGRPIMHVPPSMAPALARGGVLGFGNDGEIYSIAGDPVVIGGGYEIATPHVFFTAGIKIELTPVDDEGGPLPQARLNTLINAKNILATIDVPPCGIVRVGS